MGRGTENPENYKNIKLSFHNLGNLEDIQSSWKLMMSIQKTK